MLLQHLLLDQTRKTLLHAQLNRESQTTQITIPLTVNKLDANLSKH